jgi:hypothetical protein
MLAGQTGHACYSTVIVIWRTGAYALWARFPRVSIYLKKCGLDHAEHSRVWCNVHCTVESWQPP